MTGGRSWLGFATACGVLLGCSAETSVEEREVAVISAALSVCDEAVPANRSIDGIPAYAQCAASENSEIYSNNGIDTATTQMGPDWVRTQRNGGYQCTELARRYLYFKWNIDWVPRGNAGSWCDTPPPESIGVVQTMTPVHGDIMVLAPGSCGAAASTGHVTVVDEVDPSGRLVVVEQNRARRGTYQQSCAKCFLHVVANDGAPGPVGTAGSGAGAGAGSGGEGGAGAAGMAEAMPQAGTMAAVPPQQPPEPPQTMPPAMQPPSAAPATPEQAPAVPAAPAGAAGSAADSGASGVAAAWPPAQEPQPSPARASKSEAGCSVGRGGAPGGTRSRGVGALLFALVALASRARRRGR